MFTQEEDWLFALHEGVGLRPMFTDSSWRCWKASCIVSKHRDLSQLKQECLGVSDVTETHLKGETRNAVSQDSQPSLLIACQALPIVLIL